MFDDAYKHSLETILQHLSICDQRFAKINSPTDFVTSENGKILLNAIVTRLQAVGENVKNISRKHNLLQINYPEIEWSNIIRFRDFISHHYEMLDYEIVFEICENYLPKLTVAISSEIAKFQ